MGWASEHMIEVSERGYEDVDRTICQTHITDSFLLAASGNARFHECSFCGRNDELAAPFAVEFDSLMPLFMETFWNYYGRLDSAAVFDGEFVGVIDTSEAVWYVGNAAFDDSTLDAALEGITGAIVDTEVSTWFNYMGTDDLEFGWSAFSDIAKHVSRFVVPTDRESRSPMARVIGFLDQLTIYVDGTLDLVRPLQPGTPIYRGRLVDGPHGDLPTSAEKLGPAPRDKATSNRMSPAGVPMFYGSEDQATAVAEIAFHGARPYAVVGAFVSEQELQILDLTETPEAISPFDLDRRDEARMREFLREFVDEVTRPVIPDERQHIEYAPTQVLTEYLRWRPQRPIDGIALPSAQTGKRSYVLFLDAVSSRQEETQLGSSLPEAFHRFLRLDQKIEIFEIVRKVESKSTGWFQNGTWVMQPGKRRPSF